MELITNRSKTVVIPSSSPIRGRGRWRKVIKTHTRQDRICMPVTYNIQSCQITKGCTDSTQGFPNRACVWILDSLAPNLETSCLHNQSCFVLKCSLKQPIKQDVAEPNSQGDFPDLPSSQDTTPQWSQLWNLLKRILLLTVVGMAAWIGMKSNYLFPSRFRWQEHKRGQSCQNVSSNRGLS